MAPPGPRRRRRARRWSARLALALTVVVVIALAALLIVIHTRYGRELIRAQVESRMNESFIGGARIGAVEGSPLTELVLRDIVINGPDGAPAITIGRLQLELGLLPLISKQVHLAGLVAEDVDVVVARDADGRLQLARMRRTGAPSRWSVDIPEIAIHRARVAYDTGDGWVHLDDLELHGAVHMPHGQPLEAHASTRGSWRERAVVVGLHAVVREDEGVITIPAVIALIGGVTVAGTAVRIALAAGPPPSVEGTFVVNAPAAAVAQLVPGTRLPADIAVAATASADPPWTRISSLGQLGASPVRALVSLDLARRRLLGLIAGTELPVGALTGGRLDGTAAGVVLLEGALGRPGAPPVARGVATVWREGPASPRMQAAIAFDTDGARAATVTGLAATSLEATLAADLRRRGHAILLDRATLVAATRSPAKATGGRAPIHGSVRARLSARGTLAPALDLAVEGSVRGRRLRGEGVSVSSLELAIQARQLPRQPIGRAELVLEDLVHEERQLGQLKVTAANRRDGRIQVAVRSRPKRAPWLLELDALVTPPGDGDTITVELLRHHVRAGSGGNWYGSTGRLVLEPRRVAVSDLRSASVEGELALAGTFVRSGRGPGDLTARLDIRRLSLDNIGPAYRGTLDAHVDVSRRAGRWAGAVELAARGVAADPAPLSFDVDARVRGQADQLVVDASASALGLGRIALAVDIDAPKDLTNLVHWQHLHRDAIRTARVTFDELDLGRAAALAGRPGQLAGRLDGDLLISTTATGGIVQARDVLTPALAELGAVRATLQIAQAPTGELTPTLSGQLGELGRFQASAQLAIPGHLFDPAAWRQLGGRALQGGWLRVDDVAIEPALLGRLGVTAPLRGRADISGAVGAGLTSARVAVAMRDVRGGPVAEPITAYAVMSLDGHGAKASLELARGTTLLDVRGRAAISIDRVRADPRAVLAAPLQLTATVPWVPARTLLFVVGRSSLQSGTVGGVIEVAGTLARPTARAHLVGANLEVPARRSFRPGKRLERVVLDATWDGSQARIALDGRQQRGSLRARAVVPPGALEQGTAELEARDFDLVPLLAFAPGPASGGGGRLDAHLRVRGLHPATARVIGELHLTRARLPLAPQIGTLRRAKVDVVLDERALKLDVAGRLGGGDLALASTIALDGARPTRGTATLTLRGVSPIGSEVQPVIDAQVAATLRRDGERWIADVHVRDARVEVPQDDGDALAPVGAPSDMVFATGERAARSPRATRPRQAALLAHVTLGATYLESPEVRGIVAGAVDVRVDGEEVGLTGQIVADRADVELFGRRYQVDRAAVRFDGSTDPLLDLQIAHDFPDVTTVTRVRGRLSDPELIMTSEPGIYSQGQLLGFLLGGEPAGDPTAGSAGDLATVAGTSIVANTLGRYVRNALPIDIDVLRYEAASASTSAAITVGTWLTRSLFVAYRHRMEARPDENVGEGEIEYWLSRRVVIEAIIGDRGYSGLDLLWRRRY